METTRMSASPKFSTKYSALSIRDKHCHCLSNIAIYPVIVPPNVLVTPWRESGRCNRVPARVPVDVENPRDVHQFEDVDKLIELK